MHRLASSWILLVVALALPSVAGGQGAPDEAVAGPEALAELAIQQQPSLDALRARVDGLRRAASTAKVWTDPMVGLEFSNLPVTAPWIDQHAMSGIQLKVQQRFPAPGQPRARAAAADARTDAAVADIAVLENALRGEVRARYWDLSLVRQLRGTTEEHVAELDGLLASVEARYQVGAADQHDLLQLQLRRDRLAETLPDLDAHADAVQAALNGALARDPMTPIPTPSASAIDPLPGTSDDRLASLSNHPDLQVLGARAAAERAEAERARAEAAPGPTAWLGYRIRAPQSNGDAGTNFASIGVSVPLPAASIRRWRALASAAESRALAAESASEARRARLASMLVSAELRHTRAADRATAYRDSLETAARAALDSTRAAYQVDRAGFADLIRAAIDLLDVQRQRLRSEAEAAAARGEVLTLLNTTVLPGATP